MPRATTKTAPPPAVVIRERFNWLHVLGGAILTVLVSLLGTAILSSISFYVHMATLTQQVEQTSQTLNEHLKHSVDKEAYEKRDASIQKQLNDKASKDEVDQLRNQVKEELIDLKDTIHSMGELAVRAPRR